MQNNVRRPVPPYISPPPPVEAAAQVISPTQPKSRKGSQTLTRELEVVDLNSYASRKSAIGGALGISLFSSNTDQLVTLINVSNWSISEIVTLSLIIFSLILQVYYVQFQTSLISHFTLLISIGMHFYTHGLSGWNGQGNQS